MNKSMLNNIAGFPRQTSRFVKATEAIIIGKILKMIMASEADLAKYDPRSPAVIFAKSLKRVIGTAGGQKVGKAYLAYSAMKELNKALNPVIKESIEEADEINDHAKGILAFIDEMIVEPENADLIPLINESQGNSKYKLLDKTNRKAYMKELIA
ncbi:hypothetical protein ACEUB7_07540 [Aeromonas veronii]